jgi:hypothetical protein
MSCHRYSHSTPFGAGPSDGRADGPRGRHGCAHWRPLEIAAVVFAFLVFWPLGLALLFFKLWRGSFGYEGDMFGFAREQASRFGRACGFEPAEGGAAAERWRGPSFMRSTGNVAFDEWREGELARLEEERRKLAEAEREFAEHIEQLRRARDREEFESFMKAHKDGAT